MHHENQENDSLNSIQSAFLHLVPDCRNLIFDYVLYTFTRDDLRFRAFYKSRYDPTSDFNFALHHFKCHVILDDEHNDSVPLPENLYSLRVCVPYYEIDPRVVPHGYFQQCSHLVELVMTDTGSCRDDMFQHMESLEILKLEEDIPYGCLSNDLFTYLKHLRHLELSNCSNFTDRAFENLYNGGSRLERLNIINCCHITDLAFSFFKDHSLRELEMWSCDSITGEGLKHLRGVESLTLWYMDNFNCHEAFKCLEGSVQYLRLCNCRIPSFDDKAMSYLHGISKLDLFKSRFENLTETSFRHLAGSIKQLEISGMWRSCSKFAEYSLFKNILWHLSGIEYVDVRDTGIRITEEDLPRLQQVFSNVSELLVTPSFADDSTMKQLEKIIEGNGGRFVLSDFWRMH